MSAGWSCVRVGDGPDEVHVVPNDDAVEHFLSADCVCGTASEHVPCEDGPDGWLVTHHALDGRL